MNCPACGKEMYDGAEYHLRSIFFCLNAHCDLFDVGIEPESAKDIKTAFENALKRQREEIAEFLACLIRSCNTGTELAQRLGDRIDDIRAGTWEEVDGET